mmetsp:Transcript_34794/g.68686  ORF Transcript_34794/g.68686 Transcript_34794/m.68686 type:complete len:217 (+) Transcript_34794:128-778(+)
MQKLFLLFFASVFLVAASRGPTEIQHTGKKVVLSAAHQAEAASTSSMSNEETHKGGRDGRSGKCSCGAVSVSTKTDPILVAFCHCSNCRAFVKKDVNQTSLFWSRAVKVEGPLEYTRTKALGGLLAIDRGKCAKCREPICEYGRRLYSGWTFPVASVLGMQPTMHLFFGSGKKQEGVGDGLRKIEGDAASFLHCTYLVVTRGLAQIPSVFFNKRRE